MTKISNHPEKLIMNGGRIAIAYLGWTHGWKAFVIGAFAGMKFSEPAKNDAKISDHLKINALTCRENPAWIQALVGITFFITHLNHHAFRSIPITSPFCGYILGAYGASWIWLSESKNP